MTQHNGEVELESRRELPHCLLGQVLRLTAFTDYSLRMLLYLAMHPDELVPTHQVARAFSVSTQHLAKVAQHLVALELVESRRGIGGGFRLAVDPEDINLAEVVRDTEPNDLLECFDADRNECPIAGPCKLRRVLRRAQDEFYAVLGEYTLADIASNRRQLAKLLALGDRAS